MNGRRGFEGWLLRRPFESPVDRVAGPPLLANRCLSVARLAIHPTRVQSSRTEHRANEQIGHDRIGWKRAAGPECQPVVSNRLESTRAAAIRNIDDTHIGQQPLCGGDAGSTDNEAISERNSGQLRSVASQTVVSTRSLVPVMKNEQQGKFGKVIES